MTTTTTTIKMGFDTIEINLVDIFLLVTTEKLLVLDAVKVINTTLQELLHTFMGERMIS